MASKCVTRYILLLVRTHTKRAPKVWVESLCVCVCCWNFGLLCSVITDVKLGIYVLAVFWIGYLLPLNFLCIVNFRDILLSRFGKTQSVWNWYSLENVGGTLRHAVVKFFEEEYCRGFILNKKGMHFADVVFLRVGLLVEHKMNSFAFIQSNEDQDCSLLEWLSCSVVLRVEPLTGWNSLMYVKGEHRVPNLCQSVLVPAFKTFCDQQSSFLLCLLNK